MIEGFSSHKYELGLFMNSPIAIAYVDTTGKFMAVNHMWSELLGYSTEEFEKLTFQEITHPADIQADVKMMKKLINNPLEIDSYSMIKRYISKEGKTVWCTLYVYAILEDGKIQHFISSVVPLPNGGKYKVEKADEKIVQVRPTITIGQFIKDNWQWFAGLIIPAVVGTIYFAFKLVIVMSKILEKLQIPW